MNYFARPSVVALTSLLVGCTSTQNNWNTVEMANGVSYIRQAQVLRNISSAIDDPDMVPSQILLDKGQSTIDTGTTPTFKFPNFDFSIASREFDIGATDTWHAQWVFTSVTDADDLRRLRNLYALVASDDGQYEKLMTYIIDHFPLHPGETVASCPEVLASSPRSWQERNPTIGSGPGSAPPWRLALCTMEVGDSIGCKLFQEGYQAHGPTAYPFRRWLFWRKPGEDWQPEAPGTEVKSLGTYGNHEIGVTSGACFDDFVILVQGQLPKTQEQQKQSAGPGTLNSPP